MRNAIINNKKTQIKLILSWTVIIFSSLFVTLLRTPPVKNGGEKLNQPSPHLAVNTAQAGRLNTGLAGIIFPPYLTDRPVQPDSWSVRDIVISPDRPAAFASRRSENDWLDELLDRIWLVESDGRLNPPDGDGGQAIGPLQIHPEVLIDINRRYETKFTIADLREIKKAKLIARLYITMWMDRHKEEIACRIFNGGPRGWNSQKTDEYWRKISATDEHRFH